MDEPFRSYCKNVELSEKYREVYKKEIKFKDCYNNVWRVVTKTDFLQENPGVRIALGYVFIMTDDSGLDFYAQHAFFINEEDEVIDMTLPAEANKKYYTLMELEEGEYIDLVCESQYASLMNNVDFQKINAEFIKWSIAKGFIPLG